MNRPRGYWNKETCYLEAKKYTTLTEFQKSSSGAYGVARVNDWLKDYVWFVRKSKPNGYWTYDNCYKEAQKYSSRKEFQTNSRVAYSVSWKNGWLDDFVWFGKMCTPRNHWNYETCYKEAKKYTTRGEFRNNSAGAYNVARINDWLKDYTWFVDGRIKGWNNRRKWDYDTCLQEAKKYSSRTEFLNDCASAYRTALKNDWIKDYTWFVPKCKPDGYWTYENCYKEAQKYTIRARFKTGSPGAYNAARQNGWLVKFDWMKRMCHANWTYEDCLEESKKYKSRSEFYKGCKSAYNVSRKNDWLKEFTWLKNEHILSDQVDCVYGYFFENNVVYIGRTLMRCQNKRHQQHQVSPKDTVYVYAKEQGVDVPEMTILEDNLTLKEGCAREGYWVDYYKSVNYKVLNRSKTGGIGAIGAGTWTKKKCLEEAKKYTTYSEFRVNCDSAYSAATRNGWIKEYTWLVLTRKTPRFWDYDACYAEAQKYTIKSNFIKNSGTAYSVARENGWTKDYSWLIQKCKPNGYWNYGTCYVEARKYLKMTEFRKGCSGAYNLAKNNNWLKDYTWLEVSFGKWNYDTCLELAQKCKTRSEFKEQSQSAYDVARRNGWLKDYTWLVDGHKKYGDEKRIWDYDSCSLEAKKYATRSEFQRNSAGAYNVARKNNWMKDYTWFADGRKAFGEKKRKWNYENCLLEAQKYMSKRQFQKNCSSAYTAALKNGWLKEYTWFVSGHLLLAETQRKWNKETCFAEAKKYTVRAHFKKNSSGAYNVARKNGWLDDYTWMQRRYKSGKCNDKAQLELNFG